MQYRQYGKDGPEVSPLGFGVMRLPPRRKGAWGTVNFSVSVPLIRRALEGGVNFLDSHHQYHNGLSEEAIGRALKGWKGRRVVIQTKTPFYDEKPTAYFEKLLAEAIEKTGVEPIDYLLFHSLRMDTFRKRGRKFFKFTDWAMKRGLIRNRGFSSHDTPENVQKFVDTGEFAAMLVSYNWLNPQMADTIAYGAHRRLGVAVMNPVGGGALAANTPEILRLLPGSRSASETALRYALSTPGVCVALSGMSSMEQVEENLLVASRRTWMTPRQRRRMISRLKRIQKRAATRCTGCGYCMPCPHGVDIPQNFLLLNRARFFGLTDWARRRFASMRGNKEGDKSASACKRCGACLPKCPNSVPVVRQLRETAELLG